jgi:hypothetical protein
MSLRHPRGLDIRRQGHWARQHARFINMQFKIGRFLDQGGGNFGVPSYLGELEKYRRLTREIFSIDHRNFSPFTLFHPRQYAERGDSFRPLCPKVNIYFLFQVPW